MGAIFDLEVYGLVLQSGVVLLVLHNAETREKELKKAFSFFHKAIKGRGVWGRKLFWRVFFPTNP